MKPEEVRPYLEEAAGRRLPVADLADAAWSGGFETHQRRRRTSLAVVVLLLLIGAVAAVAGRAAGGGAEPVPPSVPPSLPSAETLPRAGVIAGMALWLAPPAGSERYLDRVTTPLGDSLGLPEHAADLRADPVEQVAAVVLGRRGDTYRPLLLDADGHWAQADLDLRPLADGGPGSPLSPGAVSADGRMVAFPQPGGVVLLDATTGDVRRVDLPAQDLSGVSWLVDGHHVLVSGDGVAYRVVVEAPGYAEQAVTEIRSGGDPADVTAPYRMAAEAGRVTLAHYDLSAGWSAQTSFPLPVSSAVGQTFTGLDRVARVFVAPPLSQVPTTASRPQVVAVVPTVPDVPGVLLGLGETPSRSPSAPTGHAPPEEIREQGCCSVLGWYDGHTVLLRVSGHESHWILSWDVETGRVRRVAELEVGLKIALGPGVRG